MWTTLFRRLRGQAASYKRRSRRGRHCRDWRAKDNTRRIVHLDGDPTKLSYGYRQKLAPYKGAWETLARGEHAIEQLALHGKQAGLRVDSLLDLAKSGMNGQQLVDYLMHLRERTNAKAKAKA